MSGTLNKVMLIGHLGDEVKIHRFEDGGCVGRFPLATNETYMNKQTNERVSNTEWHNVVLRNKAAEICEKYLSKGDKVYIEGVGLQDLTAEEQKAFDARRAADAPWRTELLRVERNKLLVESDWTQAVDSPLNEQKKNEWSVYRQKLRDITQSTKNINDAKWPDKPE